MRRSNIRTLSPYEKRWMKIFAAGVSKKDIEQYVTSTGNYICNNNIAFTNHPFITAYSPHRKTILLLLSVMALIGLSPVKWLDRKGVVWRSEV